MANPNLADMTEEDAADLQFPKENVSHVRVKSGNGDDDIDSYDDGDDNDDDEDDYNDNDDDMNDKDSNLELEISLTTEDTFVPDPPCCACKTTLSEPYIRCAECVNTRLCLLCFSNGREMNQHQNDHNYVVVKNEFPLIEESTWSAKQESRLLDVIQECGFGNWIDIAKRIQGKSAEECKIHYLKHYIEHQSLPDLPRIRETRTSLFGGEPIPYLFKLQDLDEPPRFIPNSMNGRLLAGYNAARSDFDVNFDNHAESLVSELNFREFEPQDDNYRLGTSLQIAIVQAYNNRLMERARRYRILRNHGLIAFRRTISWLQRYETTITRPIADRLLIFMQLTSGIEFDYILEGLHHFGEIKNYISKLMDYRANGLKTFRSIPMFKKLSKLRREHDKDRKQYMNNPEYSWKSVLPLSVLTPSIQVTAPTNQRKVPPPLEIRGLPGSDKLTPNERELCSNARIVPANYFDYKRILINENKKIGSLRLAQARVLLKIDVNKTRKLYDFLVEEGYINKPPL
ncbi:transcriptional adapter 2-alpha-like isoform X1 [Venturia canescens]|uniref:transcriptional adapter 2-alpha-like isoform X1 n=1 Tax=Venturia canescens TaxID=32260 RepID=UPI001C9BD5A7|nr:transcriptional adapter 2-alpha-like isoform X1 [Venturia canescens]